MSNITRRTSIACGTAAIAVTALAGAALAHGPHDDVELFQAIARWRELRDIYEAEIARQAAIWDRVNAEIPEYGIREKSHWVALNAASYGERTPEQHQRVEGTDVARRAICEVHSRRLKELGYDEDRTGDLSSACRQACIEAWQVPACTLAGLRAKIDMEVVENQDEQFCTAAVVDSLTADIRRLAGQAT